MIVVVKLDSKAFYVRILIWLFFRCPDRIIPSLFKMIRPRIIKIKDKFLASFWSLWSSFLANNHYQPISSNPSNREREKRERESVWCCRNYIYSVHRWIVLISDYVVPSNLLSTLTKRICYPINESFREDMKQEQGAASTASDQDMEAMGGDTDGNKPIRS